MAAQHFFPAFVHNLGRRIASPTTPNPLIDPARRLCPNRDSCPLRRSPPHPVPCPHESLQRIPTVVLAKAGTSHLRSPVLRLRPGMERNGTKRNQTKSFATPDHSWAAAHVPDPHSREHPATRPRWPDSILDLASGVNQAKSGHGRGCLHSWPPLKNCARQRWDSDGERAKLTRGRGGDMFPLSIPLSRGCGIGCPESPETRFSALPVRPGRAG